MAARITVALRSGRRAWFAVLLLAAPLTAALPGVALASVVLTSMALVGPPTPAGVWRTYDDRTGKPRGVVRIEQHDDVLTGRVVSTLDPADAAHRCDDCAGDRQHQPIIGLEIMRGMRADDRPGDVPLSVEIGETGAAA